MKLSDKSAGAFGLRVGSRRRVDHWRRQPGRGDGRHWDAGLRHLPQACRRCQRVRGEVIKGVSTDLWHLPSGRIEQRKAHRTMVKEKLSAADIEHWIM
jgi:hypothetical protein